jgi:hypothetical protein
VIRWDRIHAIDVLCLLFCDREIFEDSDEMNQKSGRVSKKLGHFSKTDVGF